MKAYKCDRCGQLFERKVENRKYLTTIAMIQNGYLDLCEHCQIGFDEWMDKFKDKESED